jgi:hypothetical protein
MERQQIPILARALILATLLVSGTALAQDGEPQSPAAPAETLGTGFTYQGQLVENGMPVNDDCDMAFRLYDQAAGGVQVGSAITATVPITDGLFTVTLDFGSGVFSGDRRWLGIGVDCEEDGTYTDLGRQELTAAPQALYAIGAPWSGLTGVPVGFADGVDNNTTYTAGEGLELVGTQFRGKGTPYQNVVVVAQSGGDYTSVQAALDSITDAAEDNAYLVWVAPGVYIETVTMKPYVHLQGAGQEATVITSTVTSSSLPPSQATLVLTRSTSLRDLTVGNGGTGSYNVALMATAGATQTLVADVTARAQRGGSRNYAIYLAGSETGVVLQDVTGLGENGSGYNYGLYNDGGAEAVLRGGSFTARGGTWAQGIENIGSGTTLDAESVTALGENDGSYSVGLSNYDGANAVLRSGSFTAYGGGNAYGIYNHWSGATLEATSVTALAENGTYSDGLLNVNAAAMLHGGSFTARGGSHTLGIHSTGSTLEATGVTALAENGSNSNYGLNNTSSADAVLRGGSFIGRGGSYRACGIYNYSSGPTLEATGISALGEDSSGTNYGLYNDSAATAEVNSSRLTGSTYGLYLQSSTVRLGVTQLDGGATRASGVLTCFQVYDGTYASYTCP